MSKSRGKILGINARSSQFLRENRKKYRAIADDKLMTKAILSKNGIPTAELIAVIKNRQELLDFNWDLLPSSFVIKPSRGLGGEGIIVVFNRLKNGNWLTTNKKQLNQEDLFVHLSNILDGNYSLLDLPDVAMIEARLSVDPLYKRFSSEGIPDIRVIVYHNVPVMAMLRVPTKKSTGKANLSQGGVAIGLDIATGLTTHAVTKSWLFEKEIETHPDSGLQLRGVRVAHWNKILETAVLSARVTGLKYAGVDVSIDKKRGPVVLELNARPGLGIQIANMAPLRERLNRLQGLKVDSLERGIAIAQDLFGSQVAAEVERMTGRQVIGLVETLVLNGKEKIQKKLQAKIDTGADSSSIDAELAEALGFSEAMAAFAGYDLPEHPTREEAEACVEDHSKAVRALHADIAGIVAVHSSHGSSVRIQVRIPLALAGYKMTVVANVVDRSHLTYPVLIGRRDLSHFLIDTTKKIRSKKPHS